MSCYGEAKNKDIPCYGCIAPKRHPGCHDRCQPYLSYKAKNDKKNEIERVCKSVNYNRHYL